MTTVLCVSEKGKARSVAMAAVINEMEGFEAESCSYAEANEEKLKAADIVVLTDHPGNPRLDALKIRDDAIVLPIGKDRWHGDGKHPGLLERVRKLVSEVGISIDDAVAFCPQPPEPAALEPNPFSFEAPPVE